MSSTDHPNILLIQADQLTSFALGCYGHPTAITSNIDHLAEEFSMQSSEMITIIGGLVDQNEIRGFFTTKRKEFLTIDYLKAELNKKLEGA